MSQFLSIVQTWIQPLAVALVLTYCYSQIENWRDLGRYRTPLIGTMFGLAAIYAMTSPLVLAEGLYIDLRTIYISISAALFGPIAGAMSLLMAAGMRIHMGGTGVFLGLGGIALVYAGALVWRVVWPTASKQGWFSWLVLGLVGSLNAVMGLFLPDALRTSFFTNVVPSLVLFAVIGTIALAYLLKNEQSRAKRRSQLEIAATTDPLTNLLNRRSAKVAVDNMVAPSRDDMGRAMLTFDVDHFKSINDDNGHAVGDAVLQAIAARVKSCLRPGDIFSRIGGDEFLIVLPQISLDGSTRVSERCRESVADTPIAVDGENISCTISLGADWQTNPPDFSDHLAAADRALYRAKRRGRNCVALTLATDGHSPEPHAA